MPWLGALLANLLGTSVARMLTGAGLALVTFAAITPIVLSLLNGMASSLQGLDAALLAIIARSGMGEAISAIGAAIMTRVAIDAGKVAITKS